MGKSIKSNFNNCFFENPFYFEFLLLHFLTFIFSKWDSHAENKLKNYSSRTLPDNTDAIIDKISNLKVRLDINAVSRYFTSQGQSCQEEINNLCNKSTMEQEASFSPSKSSDKSSLIKNPSNVLRIDVSIIYDFSILYNFGKI